LTLSAQTVDAVILPPKQNTYISDFFNNPNLFRVIVTNKSTQPIEVKIGGKLIYEGTQLGGSDIANSDIFTLNPGANTFNGEDVFKQFLQGRITVTADKSLQELFLSGQWPAGIYEWCIEVQHARTNAVLLPTKCARRFVTGYQIPVLLTPREGQVLNNPGTILFRWTPLAPAFQNGIVYYEVRVFDIKAGQTPMQAFQSNYPIIEKKVASVTTMPWPTEVPIENGRYVWTVRPLDAQDLPICFPTQYAEIVEFNIIKGDPNNNSLGKLAFEPVFPGPGSKIKVNDPAKGKTSAVNPSNTEGGRKERFSSFFEPTSSISLYEETGFKPLNILRSLANRLNPPPDPIVVEADGEYLRFRVDLSELGASSTGLNNGLRIYMIEKKPGVFVKGALLQAIQSDRVFYKSPLLNINAQTSNIELSKILPDSMAGKEFAWMIRAEVAGKNFDSDVYTFEYQAIHLQRKKQQLKIDCECKDTTCMPPVIADKVDAPTWKVGDTLMLGRYELRLTEWSDGDGKGIIDLPFGKVGVKVGLSNIRANKAKQIFNGTATLEDSDFPKEIKNMGVFKPTPQQMADLNTHFARLTGAVQEGLKMPFSIKQHLGAMKLRLPFDVLVTGMRFSPEQSDLDLAVVIENKPGEFIKFAAQKVPMGVNGISLKDLKLYIVEDVVVNNLTLKATNESNAGTYIQFDCNGFLNFELNGVYELSQNLFYGADGGAGKVAFSAKTQELSRFIATASVEPLRIRGLKSVELSVTNAILDRSETENSPAVKFPEIYKGNKKESWQELYIGDFTVKMPSFLPNGSDSKLTLSGKNMVFDSTGATGLIEAVNVMSSNTDTEGGFGMSIDTLNMAIVQNKTDSAYLSGKINVPFFSQDIPYNGIFKSNEGLPYYSLTTPQDAMINFWKASIGIAAGSNVEIFKNDKNKWERRANLNIEAKLDVNTKALEEFVDLSVLASLKSSLNVNLLDFEFPKLQLKGFKINYPNLKFGKLFSLDSFTHSGKVKLAGQEVDLYGVDVVQDTVSVKGKKHNRGVGLVFKMFKGIDFNFSIWSVPSSTDSTKWTFGKYDLGFGLPKFECVAAAPVVVKKTTTQVPKLGDMVDLAGFSMQVDKLASDAEMGIGRIRIPYLGTTVKVNFDNKLTLNAEGKVLTGFAVSQLNSSLFATTAVTSLAKGRAVALAQMNIDALDQIIADNTPSGISLPLSLRQSMGTFGKKLPFDVLLTHINFASDTPNMSLAMLIPDRSGKMVRLSMPRLGLSAKGFSFSDLRLQLGSDFELTSGLFLRGSEKERLTSANFNCDGFVSLDIDGYYRLNSEQFNSSQGDYNPLLKFKANAKSLNNFIGQVSADSLYVRNLYGDNSGKFKFTKAVFDRSTTQNDSIVRFPQGYKGKTDATWSGVYIQDMSLSMGRSFLPNHYEGLSFSGKNIIIDSTGMTGTLEAANVLKAGAKDYRGLSLQVDTARINILQSKLDNAVLKGLVNVPLFSTPIKYEGQYRVDTSVQTYSLTVASDASVKFFGATVTLLKGSELTIDKAVTGGEWTRRAKMDVTVEFSPKTVTMTALTNDGGSSADLEQLKKDMGGLSNLDFEFPKITLKGFKINHKSLRMGKNYGIDSIMQSGTLKIAGQTVTIRSIDLVEVKTPVTIKGKSYSRSLGLVFQLTKGIDAEFVVWMVSPSGYLPNDWTFGKFEFKAALPRFECTTIAPTAAPTGANRTLAVNQEVNVGDFKMKVTKLATGTTGTALGEGEVRIPYMGTSVKVKFDNNFKINADGKASGGIVVSDLDTKLFPNGSVSSNSTVGNIVNAAKMELKNSSTVRYREGATIQMPMSLQQRFGRLGSQLPFDLWVTNMNLSPTQQSMSLALLVPNPLNAGQSLIFSTDDVLLNGKGFGMSSLQLGLMSDIKLADNLFLNGGATGARTRAMFNCDGIESFSIAGRYEFPNTDWLKPLSGTGNVRFDLSGTATSLSDFIVEASATPMTLTTLGGSELILRGASYDNSTQANPSTIKLNETSAWKGITIAEAGLTVPSLLPNQSGKLRFSGQNLIIDASGLTGQFYAQDIFSTKIDDWWQFKVDTFNVTVSKSKFIGATLWGEVGFPIIGATTRFLGQTKQTITGKDTAYTYTLSPAGDLNMSAWRVKFALQNTSKLEFVRTLKAGIATDTARATLDAEVSLDLSADFIKQNADPVLVDLLTSKLGVNLLDFSFPKFSFSKLMFNPKGKDKISVGEIKALGDVTLAGTKLTVSSSTIESGEVVTKSGKKQGTAFVITLKKGPVPFKFRLWAVPDGKDSAKWTFGKLDLMLELPKFSCTNSVVAFTDQSSGTVKAGTSISIPGGFSMSVTTAASGGTPGSGKINVPLLGTTYDVAFGSDLQVNSKNELIKGNIITLPNQEIFPAAAIVKLPNGVTDLNLQKLQITQGLVAKLENLTSVTKFPVSLSSVLNKMSETFEIPSLDLPLDIAITGIQFTPTGAMFTGLTTIKTGDTYFRMGVAGLTIHDKGVSFDNLKLLLVDNL
jgi:hypothetical protein